VRHALIIQITLTKGVRREGMCRCKEINFFKNRLINLLFQEMNLYKVVFVITIHKFPPVKFNPNQHKLFSDSLKSDTSLLQQASIYDAKLNYPGTGQASVYVADFVPHKHIKQQLVTIGQVLKNKITSVFSFFYPTELEIFDYHDFVRRNTVVEKKKVKINNVPFVQFVEPRPKPQPPFAAKDFAFKRKRGGDGNYWISTQKTNKAFYWKRV
jgi:hypothetical protein